MFERFADALHAFFAITEDDLRCGNGWSGDDESVLAAHEHLPTTNPAPSPAADSALGARG